MTTSHRSPSPDAHSDLSQIDPRSGNRLERLIFNNRLLVVSICLLLTAFFGWQASRLTFNSNFEKTIPARHPYIQNFLKYKSQLAGLGNAVRISAVSRSATIFDPAYLDNLRQLSDEVFLLPHADRVGMKSLWTPSTRWVGITEEGLEGGPVIPANYDGSAASIHALEANVLRSPDIGQLVSRDRRSSVIFLPLLEKDADGKPIDYAQLSDKLEQLRTKYSARGIEVHITGYAKIAGDLLDGVRSVLMFFAIAVLIAAATLLAYTRCIRSTLLVVTASLVAVTWQLGTLPLMGQQLDPYSILVPFLVFAIGMSHGAQKMNGIMQDIGRGVSRQAAARLTFRRLFIAGLTALAADAVGFSVLLIIDIQSIRELALAASIGVGALIVTNLILLPVLLSLTGVGRRAALRSLKSDQRDAGNLNRRWLWAFLDRFTNRRLATGTVVAAAIMGVLALIYSQQLRIGDHDPGAPELRADSRYNRDVTYMNAAYGAASDVLAVMVATPDGQCSSYDTLNRVDALEWDLQQLPGVDSTNTLSSLSRRVLIGLNEGNPKWYEFVHNQNMLNTVTAAAPRGLYNDSCNLLTIYVYLHDHKAETLDRVIHEVEQFASLNNTPDVKFMLAAGNAGIEAATNIVVAQAWHRMLFLVYGAVILLCFIAFRSWRAVVVAVVPLVLTSLLAEALMVALGMGVKVATLPVIALGVGIGIDYALYTLSVTLARMRAGDSLSQAYYQALLFTGRVVLLTGVTLAAGVVTWAASPIKFQADMGVLLAFMFLLNMLGSMILLPALAFFLLKPEKIATQGLENPNGNTPTTDRIVGLEAPAVRLG